MKKSSLRWTCDFQKVLWNI